MSRSFGYYVQGFLLLQFVDGNEKNLTIRRVIWNLFVLHTGMENIRVRLNNLGQLLRTGNRL